MWRKMWNGMWPVVRMCFALLANCTVLQNYASTQCWHLGLLQYARRTMLPSINAPIVSSEIVIAVTSAPGARRFASC
jgi:hypothetical protein